MRFKNLLESSLNKVFPNTADMVVFNIYHLVTCKCWLWILQYMSFWCVFLYMFFFSFYLSKCISVQLVYNCYPLFKWVKSYHLAADFFFSVGKINVLNGWSNSCLFEVQWWRYIVVFFLREGRRNTLETTAKLVIKLPCKLEGSTRGSIWKAVKRTLKVILFVYCNSTELKLQTLQ